MSAPNFARKLYFSVVEDVISNVREAFLDEGVDEQVLQELKQLWENKLSSSRAVDPGEPEPVVHSNLPYPLLQQQTSQSNMLPVGTTVQHQIPVPLQIQADGSQISSAANMAFSAQGNVYQALVNVNPGAQLTLQQTANGQYILQPLAPHGSQGQMISLPPGAILQSQSGQMTQVQGQTLPQFDGAQDEDPFCDEDHSCSAQTVKSDHTCCKVEDDTEHSCKTFPSEPIVSGLHIESECPGATGSSVEIEFEATGALSKKLAKDVRRHARGRVPQFDGNHDTSSSEDDYDDDDDGNDDEEEKDEGEEEGEEEEPLNSGDDVSEEDPTEVFDADNVVVCQFEKISRNKSKWKFNLKDGIMNLEGKDHVFQRGTGDAEW